MSSGNVCYFNLSFTSPSAASTVAETPLTNLGIFRSGFLLATIQGATGGTLDVYLQVTPDGGTTWMDWVHFPQKTAGAGATSYGLSISQTTGELNVATVTTVGTGLQPALGAGDYHGGAFGDQIRALAVAGSSTSAGSLQNLLLALIKL